MWYRKNNIGIVFIVAAIIAIVGIVRPVAAQGIYDGNGKGFLDQNNQEQPYSDINEYLLKQLQQNDAFMSAPGLKDAASIDFIGDVEDKGMDFLMSELNKEIIADTNEKPVIISIQTLVGKNCGPYEDHITLGVSAEKQIQHTWGYQSTLGGSLSLSYSLGLPFLENELGIEATVNYSTTKDEHHTATRTDSWNMSTEVIVPPHQSLEVEFMAYQEQIDIPFEQTFLLKGKAKAFPTETSPPQNLKVIVFEHAEYKGRSQTYEGTIADIRKSYDTTGGYDAVNFDMLDDKISSFQAYENLRVEFYRFHDAYGLVWSYDKTDGAKAGIPYDDDKRWRDLSTMQTVLPEVGYGNNMYYFIDDRISSMRVIDLDEPYACIYNLEEQNFEAPRGLGPLHKEKAYHWKRCFNPGDKWVKLNSKAGDDYADYGGKVSSISLHNGAHAYVGSTTDINKCSLVTENVNFGAEDEADIKWIKVIDANPDLPGGGQEFQIEDYLDAAARTVMLKGEYSNVRPVQGFFTRNAAFRLNPEDCGCGTGGTHVNSVDCESGSWAYNMNEFYVTVKVKEEGGSGRIKQNGMDCGTECLIAAALDDLPVLWKVEAVPDEWSIFSGWETESGQSLSGKHKPLPGDTIYAVFEDDPNTEGPASGSSTEPQSTEPTGEPGAEPKL